MKRALMLAFAASLILAVVPAHAGGDDRVQVDPDPVEHGETLVVTCHDCFSGEDWDAEVKVKILDEDNDRVDSDSDDADDDGTTKFRFRIRKADYPPGEYEVVVKCKHHFDEGGSGTWYTIRKTFKVKKSSD